MLLLAAAVVIGGGVWFMMRAGGRANRTTRVTSLLPAETLGFLHVPEFNRARKEWRETDVYKLWQEPAVQAFLQKPMAGMPARGSFNAQLQELESLRIRDAFLAITSWQPPNDVKAVGGFRFDGSTEDVKKTVDGWRARLRENTRKLREETVEHGKRRIEVATAGAVKLATVYHRDWFFAANDVPQLTALLDRLDGAATAGTTLSDEANYTRAVAKLPQGYAVAGYARVDEYFARLAAAPPPDVPAQPLQRLRNIRNVAAATRFENGKIRDVVFVTMPKTAEAGELTRSSLPLTTAETFLYITGMLGIPAELPADDPSSPSPLGGRLQQIIAAIRSSGVTLEQWNRGFGAEFGIVADWQPGARIPALFATLPVKDTAVAQEIAAAVTGAGVEGSEWSVSEREGAVFYSQRPPNPLLALAPTIAIANDRAVAGLDAGSVAAAIKRSAAAGAHLGAAPAYTAADSLVPKATNSFVYLDTALLYTRLDAALRPMLIMSAAFMPAIAQSIDLAKLPEPSVITQHLSPIVLSQSYTGEG